MKYWGKSAVQIPKNPSLSFSLKKAVTTTKVVLSPSPRKTFDLSYLFENESNKFFESRIRRYLESLFPYFPFLKESSLEVSSKNTFPHSSGIASSASGMSALALCICSLEEKLMNLSREDDFYRKASYMARLGSGSASRSVYGNFVSWGKVEGIERSSDVYANPLDIPVGNSFRSLNDAVLIVSREAKKVSSSQGHDLMENHPFAAPRFQQAQIHYRQLLTALRDNDIQSFIRITENEALMLHGLMMSSDPGFLLLEPATLEIISKVRRYREETGSFITFTIDAGPNVHLIYPDEIRENILDFIETEVQSLCSDGKWIDDRMGEGPVELNV